jgi:hypothetical protein
MYKQSWPFPDYDNIVGRFPQYNINEEIYRTAREFYLGSLAVEQEKLHMLIRTQQANAERDFIAALVLDAVHVGISSDYRKAQ